ncbi:MAG: hypothetical protein ACFFDC_15580, partial [Promethearchaeota archaeon]
MVLMGQSGITNATLLASNRILEDTFVGSNPFVEGLELIAAEDSALIAQYYHWGGQKTFPLNPDNSAFSNLDVMYIISSNQENWHEYWPRSLWEFRDGATVVFQFSQDIEDSLDDAEEIIPELNTWMGTTLDILYGAYDSITDTTYLFYWGYMSPQNHSDFIYDEFYDVLRPSGSSGFTNFITDEVIASAPVSVVATGLVKPETEWVPLTVAAFILEDGISIDENDVHNMSIGSAFDYLGSIMPASGSQYSKIVFKLPYVANVYNSYPTTDNLYPELTGDFEWTLKAGEYIDESYDDIYVTYDMAVEELETFPQITSEVDVDTASLRSTTDPILNYTISMTNTGDEEAYNVAFAWDLGEERPEPVEIPLFDSDTYMYDSAIWKYYDIRDGLLYDTYQGFGAEILVKGWFTFLNGTLIPTENMPIGTTGYFMLDIGAVFQKVMPLKTFFTFDYSSNLVEITLENGNFALLGNIDELDEGGSESFWW